MGDNKKERAHESFVQNSLKPKAIEFFVQNTQIQMLPDLWELKSQINTGLNTNVNEDYAFVRSVPWITVRYFSLPYLPSPPPTAAAGGRYAGESAGRGASRDHWPWGPRSAYAAVVHLGIAGRP